MRRPVTIPDACLLSFALVGSLIVILTILGLFTITIKQVTDLPYFISVATESKVVDAILITMAAGLNAVLLLLVFGIPLAYVLARTEFRGKGLVESIVDIPVMLPHTIAGIMVYILFMRRGIIGAPLSEIGIIFEGAYPGIVAAMFFVSSPYFVNAVRDGFEKVPIHIENVARTLGASRFQAFRLVVLPLSVRHIFNGSILAWGRGIGEFAAIIMIAYYPMVISTLIYYKFTTAGLKESTAVAFAMILVCLVVFAMLRVVMKRVGVYDDRV
jgi:molybdate/tungstate transport system permease protein